MDVGTNNFKGNIPPFIVPKVKGLNLDARVVTIYKISTVANYQGTLRLYCSAIK